ncbi:unnamed protein product [Gongylonema pulchrum]|uniref:Focal_AT domain-containing protein n=1 Tax=Gongylonema pulchrum TaxID=637853 RepID=A0A183EBM7_9BILA|nr:unnamed protein product [Gongylonema pulchrum]
MNELSCSVRSVEVCGQLSHFGHALDPRFVFPATSSEKVSTRARVTRPTRMLPHRSIALDLHDDSKSAESDSGSVLNIDNENNANELGEGAANQTAAEEGEAELLRRFGPVHPNSDEIDIRLKNIDRLCSFLFENVSEPLYRLNDEPMDMVLRALRTTQNAISNLSSMLVQIKEGDPDVLQKFQRRGPSTRFVQWMPSWANSSARVQNNPVFLYTVYYRHVPSVHSNDEYEGVFVVDEDQVEGEVSTAGDDYYENYPAHM